jgi:UPF0716 protein FxsA
MPALLLLVFLVVPVVELIVIFQVGDLIGGWLTFGLLVALSVAGAMLVRREGARAWRSFNAAVAGGRVPAKEVADGALVLFGGALLMTPGFLSDILGLLCLLPPTRAVMRRVLLRVAARRFVGVPLAGGRAFRATWGRSRTVDGGPPGGRPRSGRGPDATRGTVIDGELDEPPGRR